MPIANNFRPLTMNLRSHSRRNVESPNSTPLATYAETSTFTRSNGPKNRFGPRISLRKNTKKVNLIAARALAQNNAPLPENQWEHIVNSQTLKTQNLKSDRKTWSGTYWPMSGFVNEPNGDPRRNLWAKNGPLDKFDKLLKARGLPTGALAHEKQPALNWLVGRPTGYYVPSQSVSESNFEITSGVQLDPNRALSADRSFDFIDSRGNFRPDGKTDGLLSVGWWGSCDKVAMAGMLFTEPKKAVTVSGIEFTPNDIKGLLAIIADSQSKGTEYIGKRFQGIPDRVHLRNGEVIEGYISNYTLPEFRDNPENFYRHGNIIHKHNCSKNIIIRRLDGKDIKIPAQKVSKIEHETDEEPSPIEFHEGILDWLSDKRPFAMDTCANTSVWNYSYDNAKISVSKRNPTSSSNNNNNLKNGDNGPVGDGNLWDVEVWLSGASSKKLSYWLEIKDDKVVNSGWKGKGPAFMWRPKASSPVFTGHNSRNPFVRPELVKELYEQSISDQ